MGTSVFHEIFVQNLGAYDHQATRQIGQPEDLVRVGYLLPVDREIRTSCGRDLTASRTFSASTAS